MVGNSHSTRRRAAQSTLDVTADQICRQPCPPCSGTWTCSDHLSRRLAMRRRHASRGACVSSRWLGYLDVSGRGLVTKHSPGNCSMPLSALSGFHIGLGFQSTRGCSPVVRIHHNATVEMTHGHYWRHAFGTGLSNHSHSAPRTRWARLTCCAFEHSSFERSPCQRSVGEGPASGWRTGLP